MSKIKYLLRKKSGERQIVHPPERPPVPKAPSIKIQKSTFADDWYNSFQDPKFYDITFIVEGVKRFHAHSIILCSSCPFFGRILASSSFISTSEQHELTQSESFSRNDLNAGKIEGISCVDVEKTAFGSHIVIKLSEDIKTQTFVRVLEFLYAGKPHFEEHMDEEELLDMKRMSTIFEIPYFDTILDNIMRKEEFLNSNILALFNHQRVSRLKSLYFNMHQQADVLFHVQGMKVYAHKVVLCTRSDVMAAMFSGHFLEGSCGQLTEITIPDTSHENFCALLEYLYTDHAPLKQLSDVIGLLVLADEKSQHRLVNLCELYISRMVGKSCQHGIEESDLDVIGLLNTAHLSYDV